MRIRIAPIADPLACTPRSPDILAPDILPQGGLARGRLHEFYSADPDDAAAAGLVAGAAIAAMGAGGAMVWLRDRRSGRSHGVIQGSGWADMGGTPERALFILADDAKALLRAAYDAVRSSGAAVVVIESHGQLPELDLTASRRLAFAAEKSGVLLLQLRHAASPVPSAAETRWSVAAAPSRALPANAPGLPCFDIELLRQRSGPAGGRWRLEWDRDQRIFREAALSGAVLSLPASRTAAAGRGAARYAA